MFSLPDIPQHPRSEAKWGQLYGASLSALIAATHIQQQKFSLVLTDTMNRALSLESELSFFLGEHAKDILHFPDWETLPYDVFSPHQDIISERLTSLNELLKRKQGMLILPISSLLQRIAPQAFIESQSFIAQCGDKIDIAKLKSRLTHLGYHSISQVMEHGEYAVRGSILDIFPMGAETPLRLDFFDDELETIRLFDTETQRTIDSKQSIEILPAHEFSLNEQAISAFRQRWRDRFEGDPQNCSIYTDVSNGLSPAGIEYYLPLFYENMGSLFDYLPNNTLVFDACGEASQTFFEHVCERYEQRRHNIERPILSPDELYLRPEEAKTKLSNYPKIALQSFEVPKGHNFGTQLPSNYPLNVRDENPSAALQGFLSSNKTPVLFVAESAGRKETFLDLLRGIGIAPKPVQSWSMALEQAQSEPYLIGVAPLDQGLHSANWVIITESQVFGERVAQSRRRRASAAQKDAQAIINSLEDLSIGAPVVHEHHGVGRYQGLHILDLGDITQEFVTLHYAQDDKLYVPVSDLHLITRYSGASADTAPLHKLGSDTWGKQKSRAAKQARDVAAELLAINAKRASVQGQSFTLDTLEYELFCSGFAFEETADQQSAIDDVLKDMQAQQPMDRVVCGDVGFGKTEVALRAAFLAASNGKQVCMLAPTTLLAQQHYETFKTRFADWPVRVACLSRFGTKKQQDEVIQTLADGQVDIVIGTHKLLQPSITFKDLGLLIVDEEQRFGVRHKEQMKKMRAHVDILTLTATPIPRTLNMAMSGLRGLSIIATPPQRRTAIKTFVSEWDDTTLKEAVERELARGGQVYFVHNKIETIARMQEQLAELMPETRIGIGHGQMSERDLESVMLDFYHKRINILLCTTIIESGIDVPNANTIIINRADKFGLAQLHQMRGRVGRSHHRAYAYLITPHPSLISADAKKRLEAIESLEDLGAGFTLATHDLEIRGAGELLGSEQSGQIQEVGFSMYTDMLKRAVKALKNGELIDAELPTDYGVEIDLGIPSLLPSDYVPDVHMRLMLYKRLASQTDMDGIREMKAELIDRFGELPEATENLLAIARMKLLANALGASKIDAGRQSGKLIFNQDNKINNQVMVGLIQNHPTLYRFEAPATLKYMQQLDSASERLDFIFNLIETLTPR